MRAIERGAAASSTSSHALPDPPATAPASPLDPPCVRVSAACGL